MTSSCFDTVNMTVAGVIKLTSTSAPDMQPINGRMTINLATAKLEIQVDQLDFYRRITLTGPQSTFLQDQIRGSQNALEGGLVSLGLISGTQATGS
jgi:hypothetical protein